MGALEVVILSGAILSAAVCRLAIPALQSGWVNDAVSIGSSKCEQNQE
jgi:hypothetical protein